MKKNTISQIVDAVKQEIFLGKLKPGVKLEEQVLADRHGVSRTPIREALRQLTALGLVETRNRRGVWVTEVTVEELAQMFEAMGEIEALCARLAAQRMTPFERKNLENIHFLCYEAAQNDNTKAYILANEKFHHVIYEGTHNTYVQELATQFRNRTAPFRNTQFNDQSSLKESFSSHSNIVDAIAGNRPEDAFSDMHAHATSAHMQILNQEMTNRLNAE